MSIRTPASLDHGRIRPRERTRRFRGDISSRGVFFYSDFSLNDGQYVEFVVEYLKADNRIRLHLAGHVVCVEQAAPTLAVGIAVAFDSLHDKVPRARMLA